MGWTRRQVLAGVAATGGLATAGGLGLVGSWWDRTPAEGLVALAPEEYALVQAIGEAWAPPGGEPAMSGADANVGAYLDLLAARMAPTQRKAFKLLLHGLDAASLPTHGARYTALRLDARTALLADWMASDNFLIRQAISAVTVLVALAWSEHPEVARTFAPLYRCGFGR